MAKGDSAASHHYWREKDAHVLSDISDSPGPPVLIPDGTTITSTKKGILPISQQLSQKGSTAMILPGLSSASLISIGQLCDDGCKVFLNEKTLLAVKDDKVVLKGIRNRTDNLWDIPVQKKSISCDNYEEPRVHAAIYSTPISDTPVKKKMFQSTQKIKHTIPKFLRQFNDIIDSNIFDSIITKQMKIDAAQYCPVRIIKEQPSLAVIIQKKKTHMELAQYLHAACFSPVKSTFVKGIKNNHFTSWPGLTPNIITKHLPDAVATVQGHLHQERQNLQSTKPKDMSLTQVDKIRGKIEQLKAQLKPDQTLEDAFQEKLHLDGFPVSPSPNTKTNGVAEKLNSPNI